MKLIKKAAGAALIYAGFLGGAFAACAAEGLTSGKLFAAIVGCGIALLCGVALRGAE